MRLKTKNLTISKRSFSDRGNIKRTFLFLLKTGLSGFAIILVADRLDIRQFSGILRQINIMAYIPAILFFTLSKLFSVIRTDVLMSQSGLKLTFASSLKLYWMGMFYNQFLPGGIGGDAYKVLLLKEKKCLRWKDGAGIMFNDRISGLVALCVMTALLYYFINFNDVLNYFLWIVIPLIVLLYRYFLVRFYPAMVTLLPELMLYSACVQIMQFFSIIFIMFAIGLHEHYPAFLFIFSVSSIASNLPVSIGGIGIRELVFLTGSGYFDLVPEQSVLISILFYAASFIVALPGILWVFIAPFQVNCTQNNTVQTGNQV